MRAGRYIRVQDLPGLDPSPKTLPFVQVPKFMKLNENHNKAPSALSLPIIIKAK